MSQSKPYGLIADLHFHSWSAFSEIDESGVNSRLSMLLKEIDRVAAQTKAAGGTKVYVAGDVFHVRGSLAPSVLNPVKAALLAAVKIHNVTFVILPGNHDMERRDSHVISNAVTALESDSIVVCSYPTFFVDDRVAVFPWFEKVSDFCDAVSKFKDSITTEGHDCSEFDILIHAPVNEVILNLPSHGLSAEYLQGIGFKRVFAGHFHNHKDLGGGVFSIGAIAHHTWSDVGTKAGFLIVTETEVKWFKSHCPDFVEIGMIENEDDMIHAKLRADGNYVKVRTDSTKTADINGLKDFFLKAGAKGVVVHSIPKATAVRPGAPATKTHLSLEETVAQFAKTAATKNYEAVNRLSQEILAEASIV
jgi:DNA repair exonuclease SbcCD nuclease subunit